MKGRRRTPCRRSKCARMSGFFGLVRAFPKSCAYIFRHMCAQFFLRAPLGQCRRLGESFAEDQWRSGGCRESVLLLASGCPDACSWRVSRRAYGRKSIPGSSVRFATGAGSAASYSDLRDFGKIGCVDVSGVQSRYVEAQHLRKVGFYLVR